MNRACYKDAEYLRTHGHIAVYVSVVAESGCNVRRIIGVIGIIDSIEADARSTVATLHRMGIEVWMCTGDHELTAKAVAREVGIDAENNVCANVSPGKMHVTMQEVSVAYDHLQD